jgi:hypothetical protein
MISREDAKRWFGRVRRRRCFTLTLIWTISKPVSGLKRQAVMASTRFKAEPEAVTREAFGEEVMRRRAALGGEINMPRNSGKRRTESKKALLVAIEAAGGKW